MSMADRLLGDTQHAGNCAALKRDADAAALGADVDPKRACAEDILGEIRSAISNISVCMQTQTQFLQELMKSMQHQGAVADPDIFRYISYSCFLCMFLDMFLYVFFTFVL